MEQFNGGIAQPDTYHHRIACGNCSSSLGLKIPLGVTVLNYTESHTCSSCGCMLMGKMEQEYRHPTGTPMIYVPYQLRPMGGNYYARNS